MTHLRSMRLSPRQPALAVLFLTITAQLLLAVPSAATAQQQARGAPTVADTGSAAASQSVAPPPSPDQAGLAEPAPAGSAQDTCTDVKVGSAESYDCLNAQLRALAGAEPKPSSLDAPLTANSPGYKTGTANASATANRLGSNYGKSAIAARPSVTYPSGIPKP